MSLMNHLSQQLHSVNALVVIMEKEQALLSSTSSTSEDLLKCSQEKVEALAILENLERRRHAAQLKFGYPDNREGAALAAKDQGCSSIWDRILAATVRANQLNTLNGEMLNSRKKLNDQMLKILKPSEQKLYGPSGHSIDHGKSRVDYKA